MLKPCASERSKATDPLRVAVLCSHRAPGLEFLLEQDRRRGELYELHGCISTESECLDEELLEAHDIQLVHHDIRRFYDARRAPLGDPAVRQRYDRATSKLLQAWNVDLVVLCGYLYVVTRPLLDAFPGRVVNLHHSDLGITEPSGRPRYRGLRSVREAIFAGEQETRSTVHLVTEEVDAGPQLIRSWSFPVHPLVRSARQWGASDILKAYAYAHREWMMRSSWGPLLAATIELFARDRVRAEADRVIIAGRPGPLELEPPTHEAAEAAPEDLLPTHLTAEV